MKFFVPAASTPEMADDVYLRFVKAGPSYPPAHPSARLFRISWRQMLDSRPVMCVAEVGKEIANWPEPTGLVLAIIETTQLVFVNTVDRRGRGGGPIYVGPQDVTERVHFEDYPWA